MEILCKAWLHLKIDKCDKGKSQVKYYIVSEHGPPAYKMQTIESFPKLKSPHRLCCLFGMFSFFPFCILKAVYITAPLNNLLKLRAKPKKVHLVRKMEAEREFQQSKATFFTFGTTVFLVSDAPLPLGIDVSKAVIGAALEQEFPSRTRRKLYFI